MEIHERLRATREDRDITQEEAAELMKVSVRQIIRWEKGTSEMGIYKLKEMCQIYRVSSDYVLGLPKGMKWPR